MGDARIQAAQRDGSRRITVPRDVPGHGAACPIEEIAQAYLASTQGDADIALRCAITDALSDLLDAERRARENSRLISKGYVREGRR